MIIGLLDNVGIVVGILIGLLAFALRVAPLWYNRYRGCDAYYYLLCVETFKKYPTLPMMLPPYYLLDKIEQWYPPGFIIMLWMIPVPWLRRIYWLITPLIDTATAIGVYVLVWFVSGGNIVASGIAGVVYGLTYPAISECQSLNSRPLGSLLLVVMMVSIFELATGQGWEWSFVALVAGVAVLATHKMTAQLVYFMIPVMVIVFWDWRYLALLVSIVALTWLWFGNLFPKMIRGQVDILRFWGRNWCNLGAHQVYSSPVYGQSGYVDRGKVFQAGKEGYLRLLMYLGTNVFIIVASLALWRYGSLSVFDKMMLWWVILTYALAGWTLFLPELRFYGEGYKYLRMAAFPIAYLSVVPLFYWVTPMYYWVVLAVALALGIVVYIWRFGFLRAAWQNPVLDNDLKTVLRYLKRDDVTTVLSIPTHLMDTVVYHCHKQVVWGTHSDNFKAVGDFFPVLRQPLEWFIKKHRVSHVLIDSGYVVPSVLHLMNPILTSGRFQVYAT